MQFCKYNFHWAIDPKTSIDQTGAQTTETELNFDSKNIFADIHDTSVNYKLHVEKIHDFHTAQHQMQCRQNVILKDSAFYLEVC